MKDSTDSGSLPFEGRTVHYPSSPVRLLQAESLYALSHGIDMLVYEAPFPLERVRGGRPSTLKLSILSDRSA